jgi:Spy/CpxP family protein refolding chaperone
MERIIDDLKLTDGQKDKAHDVLRASHEKMRKQSDEARADMLKELKAVLTADQFAKFKEAMDRDGPPPPPAGGRDGQDAPPPPPPSGRDGPPRGTDGPGGGPERVLADLKLTDKQKDQTQEILKSHHEKMRKIAESGRDDVVKQMKDVLGDDQYRKFKDAVSAQGPGGRGGRGGPGGPGRGGPGGPGFGGPGGPGFGGPGGMERVLGTLKLTDKQKDKAEEVLKAHQEKVRMVMEQAHEELLKEMKDVLSDDQFKKFKNEVEQAPPGPRGGPRERPGEQW